MVARRAGRIPALVFGVFAFALLLFTSTVAHAANPPPSPFFSLPPWVSIPQGQLPPGFTWPTLPSGGTTPQPFDLGALLAQTKSCPPIEVAPNVYVPVPCTPGSTIPAPRTRTPKYRPNGPLPAYVDLPAFGLDGPVKDQAQVGICWAFALTTAAENALRRQGRQEVLSATHVLAARSEKRLYATGFAGTAIAVDEAWPYDPVRACLLNDVIRPDVWCESAYHVPSGSWRSNPRVVAELQNADAWGLFRIREESLSGDIDEIAALIHAGRSVMVDVAIDSHAWGTKGASGGTIPDYLHADRGGHAVVLVAYSWQMGERYFLVHNSWGRDWGRGGYAWIAERTLRRHMMEAAIVDVYPRGVDVPRNGAVSGT